MRFFNTIFFCFSLDKGCILIAVFGIGLPGIMLIIQSTLWSVVGFILSLTSSAFLLLGTIKQIKLAIIVYLVLEMVQVIETLIATVIVLVNVIGTKNFTCTCDSHECEDDTSYCDMIGITLGSFGCVEVVISTYFWICVLSFSLKLYSHENMITVL